MATLTFKDFVFEDRKEFIRAHFLKLFYFDFNYKGAKTDKNKITLPGDRQRAQADFNIILSNGFNRLCNKITGNRTIYVHKNSAIPLIGNVAFGIVDRDTSIIEAKPITLCNLDCLYCSVGKERATDFVAEKDYLVQEIEKICRFKEIPIEVHIAANGEPLLYADIVELINDIKKIENVKYISMETNGALLSKKLIDDLVKAGLNRFNLSINSLDKKKAGEIAGTSYPIEHVIEMARYIATKTHLIIAPVLVPKHNEDEIPALIEFALSLKAEFPSIGIQNFLNYKNGRNPAKQWEWKKFYDLLKKYEKQFNTKLILSASDFNIVKTKMFPRPFKKNEIVLAEIICPGRISGEAIAAAKNRSITIAKCKKTEGRARVRITRSKHNIYYGELIS